MALVTHLEDHLAFWTTDDGLGGFAVWGRPARREIERFVELAALVLHGPISHPRAVVADFRDLETVDADGFELVRAHVRRNAARIAALELREAVLRPESITGSVVAGFYAVAPWPSTFRVFADPARAAAWLRRPDLPARLDEIAARRAARTRELAPLDALRALLEREPVGAIEDAARTLGLSARSLQRHLRAARSTFRDELRDARLRQARALLGEGTKLAAVAAAIGFASPQHFITWFKRHTGRSPGELRASPASARRTSGPAAPRAARRPGRARG